MEIVLGNIYEKDKNGKYRRPEIVKAFELFAQSKLGIGILSEFAKKGQVIAGHKYDKDGKFHAAKIDLKIGSDNLNGSPNSGWSDYGPNGVTTYYSGSGKNTILVTLNNGLNSYNNDRSSNFKNNPTNKMSRDMYIFDRAITVVHEILIHGINDAEDYRDDGKVNSDKSAKEDHLEARKPNSSFSKQGFNVVKEMAKNFGIDMTNEKIKEMMFDFHN